MLVGDHRSGEGRRRASAAFRDLALNRRHLVDLVPANELSLINTRWIGRHGGIGHPKREVVRIQVGQMVMLRRMSPVSGGMIFVTIMGVVLIVGQALGNSMQRCCAVVIVRREMMRSPNRDDENQQCRNHCHPRQSKVPRARMTTGAKVVAKLQRKNSSVSKTFQEALFPPPPQEKTH